MGKWLNKMNMKLALWMRGRNGADELSKFLMVVGFLLLLLSLAPYLHFLYFISLALWLWACFRCYSKQIAKRQRERGRYLQLTNGIRTFFSRRRRMWRERKSYRYFRCKKCKVYVRIPRGKGKISVTCPKCRNQFVGRT